MGNETIEQAPKNVVIAAFQSGNYSVRTDPVWQYDYGLVLQITGVELPSAYEVHFSNDPLGYSKTQIGGENGVQVPDEYLLTGQMVYVWLFLHEGQDDGETRLSISIPVRRRAMPLDVEPTNVEQSVITQAIAALNQAVDETESAAAEVKEFEEKLPHITASDNGKYLKVDDETIVTADLPTYHGTVAEGSDPVPGHVPSVLTCNASEQNIGGTNYIVLDKTFKEIHDAALPIIKYSPTNGVMQTWYVINVNDAPRLVRAVMTNGSALYPKVFNVTSDSDYPKMVL